MEKPTNTRNFRNQLWLVVYIVCFCCIMIWFNYFVIIDENDGFHRRAPELIYQKDICSGRYIYVHNLPKRFNDELTEHCHSLNKYLDMCPYVKNLGLGPSVKNRKRVFTKENWYSTNQFALEIIFRERMKNYECLTNDSYLASAIYVPYYAGLDIGRHLWDYNVSVKDSLALDLIKWLRSKPEWQRLYGRDHFIIGGRIGWDFQRQTDDDSGWGSKLMVLPEGKNMTMLAIEETCWNNDFAIPYPTYFHPSRDRELYEWQDKMRRQHRPYLFSFIGAPRPGMQNSIRGQLIDQCQASKNCKFLDCHRPVCENPVNVMKTFRESVFCLQPAGDSYTRRSAFDSILAGCIPVFFHPGSAYVQYVWFFPKNYSIYSVFIPENDVKAGKVNVNDVLVRYSEEEIRAMREEVIKLIPRILYAHPKSKLKTFDDAFDISIKVVIDRIERMRRQVKGEYKGVDLAEDSSWKKKIYALGLGNQWDSYFW